jgi:hypothetical protein
MSEGWLGGGRGVHHLTGRLRDWGGEVGMEWDGDLLKRIWIWRYGACETRRIGV